MNKVLEFTNAIFWGLRLCCYTTTSFKKKKILRYDAQLEIPLENDAFQIKDKANFYFCSVKKESPSARLSSIDQYFRKYGYHVYHPGM